MEALVYGNHTVDFDSLPAVSQRSLAMKGLTHVLGNEQAAKVTAFRKAEAAEGREVSDSDAEAKHEAFRVDAIANLLAGKVGRQSAGPKATPIETVMREIATKEVRDLLKKHKLAMPKGDEVVKTPNGDFTRAQLIDRRISTHGDRIRGEAEKELRRIARAAETAGEF